MCAAIAVTTSFAQNLTPAGTLDQLRTALQDESVTGVQLTANIEGVTDELPLQIIRENFVFDGGGFTITGCVTGSTLTGEPSSHSNTLDVIADGVTVRNVTLTNTGTGANGKAARNALTVWHASDVVLENVKLIDSGGGGLQVVGATVTAKHLETSGNTWYGVGISTSTGTGAVTPLFTVDNASVFGEAMPITAESASQVVLPVNSTWGTILATIPVGGVPVTGVVATNKAQKDGDKLLLAVSSVDELSLFLQPGTQTSFDGVLLAAGEYMLPSTLTLETDITIKGSGMEQTVLKAPQAVTMVAKINAGALKNLSLEGYGDNNNGPNLNQSGIGLSYGDVVLDSLQIRNFRSGISVDTQPDKPLTMHVTNSLVDGNRTGIILTCKGNTLNAVITGNTLTNNRTFGILLNSTSANWAGATLQINRNSIHDNWFGEFETRVTSPFDLSGNYWGSTGPVVYHTFANETPSPVDAGGVALTQKPDHYTIGEIYQPVNASRTAGDLTDFTAGELTINTYYTDEAMTNLANYTPSDTLVVTEPGGLAAAIENNTPNIVLDGETMGATIQLNAPLKISSPVTISNADSTKTLAITAASGMPVFNLEAGGELTLNNIQLSGSPEAPAQESPLIMVADGATATLNGSTITGPIGDAPLIQSSGMLMLTDVTFRGITPRTTMPTRSVVTRAATTKILISSLSGEAMVDRVTLHESQLDGYTFIAGNKITISNSLFYNNGNLRLMDIEAGDIEIANVTFVNSTTASPAEVIAYTGGTAKIVNSILFTETADAITGTGSGLTATYNALKTSSAAEANSIALTNVSDIKFAGGNDYRLLPNSPLVGKGNMSEVVGTYDVDGNARTTGSKVNMGAYEAVYKASVNPGNPGTPEEPQEIPELSLLSQTESATRIGWIQIENAERYEVEIYENAAKSRLVKTMDFNRDSHQNGEDITFEITGLDTSRPCYVEIVAYDANGNRIANKGITVPALVPTSIEAILNDIHVYAEPNGIRIETESPVEAMIVEVNGNTVYQGVVNGSQTVNSLAGVYIVRLKQGGHTATRKLIVR